MVSAAAARRRRRAHKSVDRIRDPAHGRKHLPPSEHGVEGVRYFYSPTRADTGAADAMSGCEGK
jgi:hypothetical protein